MPGAAVVDYVADMLDDALPLANGNHADVTWYAIEDGGLITNKEVCGMTLANLYYIGQVKSASAVLFEHNGLHRNSN